MKVCLTIPAKGQSTRVENKNLFKLEGKTLVELACEKALRCKTVDHVYLDTESEDIIASVSSLISQGLKILKRPKELATNDINANDLMIYNLHRIEDCDLVCQTFVTSPLIRSETIDMCIEKFIEAKEKESYDSFFSVVPFQEYFWNEKLQPINFDLKKLPNSFELEKQFLETHGIYGIYTDKLIEKKTRVGDKPMLIQIPKIEALDINDYEDIEIIQRMKLHEFHQV